LNRKPITPEGYERLVKELKYGKEVLRAQIVLDIEEARAHGDLSENAEYDAAKESQSLNEARISLLEMHVAGAQIIDVKTLPQNGRVVFGTTVMLEDDTGRERTWRIVGETETDVENGAISYVSPLGRALIGQNAGDEVVLTTPGGRQAWEIIEVRYEGP
jgi:transcription elongation factor GreA